MWPVVTYVAGMPRKFPRRPAARTVGLLALVLLADVRAPVAPPTAAHAPLVRATARVETSRHVDPAAAREVMALRTAKAARIAARESGPAAKLSPALAALRDRLLFPDSSRPLPPPGRARVDASGALQVYVSTDPNQPAGLDALRAAGLRVELALEENRWVQGWIHPAALDTLAVLPVVTRVRLPDYGRTAAGPVVTEGDALLRADDVRAMGAPGPYNGSGIRVGVISDGVTTRAAAIAAGNLPAGGIVVNPAQPGNGDEGTAMLEIIHDLAPGSPLSFSGPSTSAEMVSAIQWMTGQGVKVLCDDLFFPSDSFFSDEAIATAARAAVTAGRVYVCSAGNYADSHYQGLYTRATGTADPDDHDFSPLAGVDSAFDLTVEPGDTAEVWLQWNDNFSAAVNDYDLFLYDLNSGALLASSVDVQNGNDEPVEYAFWANGGGSSRDVQVVVNKAAGVARTLEIFVFGATVTDDDLTPADSIAGHHAVTELLSCAAINSVEPGLAAIAPYSSRGPSTISLPTPQSRATPFITAIDYVEVSGVGGFGSPFAGTSAAAPHVAAICALLLDRYPVATPNQIRAALSNGAIERGAAGFDNTYGFGLVDAVNAIAQLPLPRVAFATASSSAAEGAGSVSLGLTLTLAAAETVSIPVTLSGTATAADATLAANPVVVAAGQTSGSVTVNLNADLLDEDDETVQLALGAPLNALLAVSGTAHTLTVLDDDALPALSVADLTVVEGDTGTSNALVTVTLSVPSGRAVSVPFATANGTATAGADYQTASGTLSFAAGQTSRTVTLPVIGDTLFEPVETLAVNLGTAVNATVSRPAATVSLTDADTDADGLPDDYETTFGLNRLFGGDRDLDADSDFSPNYHEFVAGTAPNNPASVLKFVSAATGATALSFPSVIGRTYRIERAAGPPAVVWIPVASGLTGTGSVLSFTDPAPPAGTPALYRVVVE